MAELNGIEITRALNEGASPGELETHFVTNLGRSQEEAQAAIVKAAMPAIKQANDAHGWEATSVYLAKERGFSPAYLEHMKTGLGISPVGADGIPRKQHFESAAFTEAAKTVGMDMPLGQPNQEFDLSEATAIAKGLNRVTNPLAASIAGGFSDASQARIAQDEEKLNIQLVTALRSQGFNVFYDKQDKELYRPTEDGAGRLPVDSGILDDLATASGEMGGSITGAMYGARQGLQAQAAIPGVTPWGKAAKALIVGGATIAGGAVGAGLGRGIDLFELRQAFDTKEKFDVQTTIRQMQQAGMDDAIFSSALASVFKVSGAGASRAYNLIKKGNVAGAKTELGKVIGLDEAQIDEAIVNFNKFSTATEPRNETLQAIEAVAQTQQGGERLVSAAIKYDPAASAQLTRDIAGRASDTLAAAESLTHPNAIVTVKDNLDGYVRQVKDNYQIVKQGAIDAFKGADEQVATKETFDFRRDNPGGDWEKHAQEAVEKSMREGKGEGSFGKGLGGSETGTLGRYEEKPLWLPSEWLAKLPGALDEVRGPGVSKFDDLAREVDDKGFLEKAAFDSFTPDRKFDTTISVAVNHKGEAFIIEGNTRAAVAASRNIPRIRATVHYMNGAEKLGGPFSPDSVAKLGSLDKAAPTTTTAPYEFDYHDLAIEPLLDKIESRITNPAILEAFKLRIAKARLLGTSAVKTTVKKGGKVDTVEVKPTVADATGERILPDNVSINLNEPERNFEALLDLRRTVNDFRGGRGIQSAIDHQAIDAVVDNIDKEITSATTAYMPNAAAWRRDWRKANVEYAKMKALEANVLSKVLQRPGVTAEEVVKRFSSRVAAVDGTFMELTSKLPQATKVKVEGAVLTQMVKNHTVGVGEEISAIHFPKLAQSLEVMAFTTPEARALKRVITALAKTFKNDVNLLGVTGNITAPQAKSYLATSVDGRIRMELLSSVFNKIKKFIPGETGRLAALVDATTEVIESPRNVKKITALLKEFQDDPELADQVRKLAIASAEFGDKNLQVPKVKLFTTGVPRGGEMGRGVYHSTSKSAAITASKSGSVKEVNVHPHRIAAAAEVRELLGLADDATITPKMLTDKAVRAQLKKDYLGVNLGDSVLMFE